MHILFLGIPGCAKSSPVPIVPASEGIESNPFSLDALSIIMCRVLNRVDHHGSVDKSSPHVGYVLLMFYHVYDEEIKVQQRNIFKRMGFMGKTNAQCLVEKC
ncbi:tRNA ligase 1-like [Bidens hawaiensis]|uniref:tRNA ligase 1-like n=1 Tax=Bidens hawaiensis TaxID=980011 RepID=UPI00404AE19C